MSGARQSKCSATGNRAGRYRLSGERNSGGRSGCGCRWSWRWCRRVSGRRGGHNKMSNGIAEDLNNLIDWKQKERFNFRFCPWMIGPDILTVLKPLFSSQRIELLCLFKGELKQKESQVRGRSVFFYGRSICSSWSSLLDG